MQGRRSLVLAVAAAVSVPQLTGARAQAPGAVAGGSPDVFVGGVSASRQGDATTIASPIVQGSADVLINGHPAALVGGRTECGGAVVSGAPTVFINGKPLARVGDKTGGCQ
jgi:uncharacterized Zn-binding protein involved in type VI secretion